ncbi:peptidyl-prolyl cis-trans isomerase SurA [Algoriphagus iocasae]|uniref:Peptidyl-prolyl cis-trans isomerase SurA n=1 Tax=Algoriphagus iocasae TaxID=1836499 RepID=A0A841MUH9_9BACT|nr:peptidylprolyl isomerase [Algoriphagus iocasae]MBB6326155.1 peptidyl-prolyl cis-trans isomerase SurA [Algoriphagus iocasae]
MNHRAISASVFSLLFVLTTTFPVFAWQDSGQGETLLTLGGEPIEKDELIYLISKGQDSNPTSAGMSRDEFEENLKLFINYKLKVREAEALGLDKTDEFYREFESFKENLKSPYLIKNSLEEGELRKAYSRMQEVVRASHILFQFPANASKDDSLIVLRMALKIRDEINAGGDINELAVEHSDDPSAKINKGDLGYFTALQMVQPFEDAAFSLQPGQVSDPVMTNFGYHIIKVFDKRPNPGQVKVSHILVRIDEEDPNSEDLARRKVADIYTEIQKENTIWEDIVKNYSEDPSSSQNGGMLPYFSVGSMIPEFEMAAFSLTEIGEVSPPVRTKYGYHILRLEEKKPIDSFEDLEESIRSKIMRDSRSTMIQSQVMAIQKARYNFDENESSVANLENKLKTFTKSQLPGAVAAKGLDNEELFTLQGKTYTMNDLVSFIEEEELSIRAKTTVFDAWYDRFTASVLNKAEDADILANNKEYQMLVKEYHDGILMFSLMNQEVWQKGIEDSVGQKAFYEENIQNYQWDDRVNAYVVKVLDITQVDAARNLLKGKEYSQELVESFETEYRTNKPLAYQTENGLIEYKKHLILSQANLNENYQEIEANGHLHLILLGQKSPAGPKKFHETRGLVIKDYQEQLDKALIDELKNKYPVQVNPKAKEEAFISLNQN